MEFYHEFLSVAALIVFFTRLDGSLSKYGIGLPLFWLIAFIAASIPLFLTKMVQLRNIPVSMLVWCCLFLGMSSISILASAKTPSLQLLENQFRSIVFLFVMLVIFSQPNLTLKWTKKTVLLITVINVIIYINEFLNPAFLAEIKLIPGRSGGLYLDANAASWAVITGLIFTIDMIKPKYRIFYALYGLLGIFTTFSRGGMACWLMVMIMFIIAKIIPSHQILVLLLSIFMTVTIISSQIGNLSHIKTEDGTDMFTPDTIRRIEFLINPLNQDEEDFDDSRLKLAENAWAKFANKPFLGNGLGGANIGYHADATDVDGTGTGTHNIYLDSVLKYGFLGILLFPFLMLATIWKAQGKLKTHASIFVLFTLAWGLFSHTNMSAFYSLTAIALMASWVHQSRWENHQT